MPHLDICSLARSANTGCHLCTSIFTEISLDLDDYVKVEDMKRDLDRSIVSPLDQISIMISGSNLEIYAECSTIPQNFALDGDHCKIGQLWIETVSHEDVQRVRSSSTSNDSASTKNQILHWLKECISTNTECAAIQAVTSTRHILPTRLLNLRNMEQYGQVQLVTTSGLPHDTGYATLSHCWGGLRALRLTVSNLHVLEAGFAIIKLPKTFRDAALITAELNIRYL